MEATTMTTWDATPGQAVHRAWLTESWNGGGGFHVWFDTGTVSDVEDAELGPLVRYGASVAALNNPARGCYGQWHPTRAAAVAAVVDELRRRITSLHDQCDRLLTDLRNETA